MNVSVIGIGRMGQGLAANLVRAGHHVTTYSRSGATVLGASKADSIAGACATDAVITMLSDDPALEQVLEGGLAENLPAGAAHISMETISPALSAKLAALHSAAGRSYVAAPVLGRPDAAAAARLFILAAGAPEAVDRCQPLFAALGQRTFVLGDRPEMAHTAKLGLNFLIASVLESLGEAFALMRKSGLQADQFLEVLTSTIFTAPVYRTYGKLIAEQKYEPAGFKLLLGMKDVRLVLAAAEAARVPMPLASVIRDHMVEALAHGQEEMDWSSIARVIAENAGLSSPQMNTDKHG
jgi:3-hydroxyisobutyrate dehydrogenase-like beta-hydroxyacid dehydrogenase